VIIPVAYPNSYLTFDGPILVAEDNAATHIIAHTGKLTCNFRHIALKTISLQTLVCKRISMFCAIGLWEEKLCQSFYEGLASSSIAAILWSYVLSLNIMLML
jgi:hypothetical protein